MLRMEAAHRETRETVLHDTAAFPLFLFSAAFLLSF